MGLVRDYDGNWVDLASLGGGGGIDYTQATDPGAVGPGKTWLKTDGVNPAMLFVRNETNEWWNEVVYVHYDAQGNRRSMVYSESDELYLSYWSASGTKRSGFYLGQTGEGLKKWNTSGVQTGDLSVENGGISFKSGSNVGLSGAFTGLIVGNQRINVEFPDGGVPVVMTILGGASDPSAGAGIYGELGSLYLRNTGTAGEMWVKTGSADTGWTKVTP